MQEAETNAVGQHQANAVDVPQIEYVTNMVSHRRSSFFLAADDLGASISALPSPYTNTKADNRSDMLILCESDNEVEVVDAPEAPMDPCPSALAANL